MNKLEYPVEVYLHNTDETPVYHAVIKDNESGALILPNIINNKDKYCGYRNSKYEYEECEYKNPYSHSISFFSHNKKNNSLFVGIYTSKGILHGFCNNSTYGYNMMIELALGSIDNFNKFKDDIVITEELTVDEVITKPFINYAVMITVGEIGKLKDYINY